MVGGQGRRTAGIGAALCAAAALASPSAAQTASTPAGTVIANVARGQWTAADRTAPIETNVDLIRVAERIDVTLSPPVVDAAGGSVAVTLTNGGNGQEAFGLAATGSSPDTRVVGIAQDRDGDGRYDPAVDTLLTGATTPVLAPGGRVALLVLVSRDAGADAATVTLAARAATGTGAPGTTFAGAGDGGADAVVGRTGAAAQVEVSLTPGDAMPTAQAPASLNKSQSVDGDGTPRPGAIVTYRLDARLPAGTRAARVADPIPAGTAYVAGSLGLDGRALSDGVDGDEGRADPNGIAVDLGDAPVTTTHRVIFQVRIL